MQAGAVWDASINGYVNPDGSVYYVSNAAAIPTITGVVAATMQAGAVWDASINGYVNPDGSVYYSTTAGTIAATIPAITGVVAATMQAGAVWDATIGGYVNPDGSVYYAPSTTSSIDLTSPSTWPVWLWAVGAGAVALFMFKKK
jgi:hypothetical protein